MKTRHYAPFLAALIALTFAIAGPGTTAGAASQKTPADKTVKWTSTSTQTAAENSTEHWKKHGSQFPECKTKEQYIAAANAFITHPPKGTLAKKRDNGDTLFYNPATNTFAVRSKYGVPRTMFKPDDGMKYWNRQ